MSVDEASDKSGLVGKTVAGRYSIARELGADRRRTLYEAENIESGVRVRLGVVRPDGTTAAERLREAQRLQSLRQPALASVLDVGTLESGDLFVATERPVGTSLRAVMGSKPLDQRRALSIVRQMLEALAAVHAIDAVHGDVRPENIILSTVDEADHITLADLGVATLADPTKTGDARYSAPESALGANDARGDIYATGAVLFELLTGHPPFLADDEAALRRLHAYAPVQTLKQRAPDHSFVRALEELVAMALAKKPEARLQSASEMIALLDNALTSIEELASPEPEAPSRREEHNSSLLLLAKDLMPASSSDAPVVIPSNAGRQVRELPRSTRAFRWGRNGLVKLRTVAGRLVDKLGVRTRFERLSPPQRKAVSALGVVLVLAIVFAIVASTCGGGGGAGPKPTHVAERADALVHDGKVTEAIDLLRRELAAHPDDPELVATLSRIADTPDSATAIAALDVLVLHRGAQVDDTIVKQASTGGVADVRAHAFLLAERAGTGSRVDRVASWTLDLDQATTCEQRRAAISKLAGTADQRALAALRRAKAHKCVERDASAAIQKISKATKHR